MSSWASSLVWNGSVSSQVIFQIYSIISYFYPLSSSLSSVSNKHGTAIYNWCVHVHWTAMIVSDCDGCQVIFKHWFQFFVLLMRTHALQDTNTLFFSHHRSATCTRSDLHHLGAQNLPWYRPSVISLSVAHWSCHLNCKCLPEHQVSVSLWTLFINITLLISLF